ncbi:hypothetical protein ACFE04_023418 [Oxalis oulophora]
MDASKLNLTAFWFFPDTYAYRTRVSFWIPLIGTRGVTCYAHVLAFRQFEDEYMVFDLEKGEPNFELKNDDNLEENLEGQEDYASSGQEMKGVEKPSKKRKQTEGGQSVPNPVQEIIEAHLAKALA